MELQRAKGVRDFLPEQKIKRDKILSVIKDVFERYGFNPLQTPIIERYDLFSSKFGQGENSDAMDECFKFKDRGERDLILRTELTVPFARVIGMNRQLRMPFKRYQIGEVFRDGPLKPGRYREFIQCDGDVVGCPAGAIDSEILKLALTVFKELDLDIELKVNNRKILNSILNQAGIDQTLKDDVIISIDKFDKIGVTGVRTELEEKKISSTQIDQILELIQIDEGSNQDKIDQLKKLLKDKEGLDELEKILSWIEDDKNVIFYPNLARGLAYYTGVVYEVFLKDTKEISSSLAGGGRYDEMIGGLLGSKEIFPAIGISFGLEGILDAMNVSISESKKTIVDYYLVAMGDKERKLAFSLINKMRDSGIKIDMDYNQKSFSKALDYANSMGIRYVLILGENELKEGMISLKDMEKGEQRAISQDKIIEELQSIRL